RYNNGSNHSTIPSEVDAGQAETPSAKRKKRFQGSLPDVLCKLGSWLRLRLPKGVIAKSNQDQRKVKFLCLKLKT
ncbi:MAG: hypothetical protein JJT78_04320, partial [Leptospira sp.]|nr:hypothetical protein [Leptospira sp.]